MGRCTRGSGSTWELTITSAMVCANTINLCRSGDCIITSVMTADQCKEFT